jgi:hypothetical protein
VVVDRRTVGASLVLLGGLMVAVGSFLPWTVAYTGFETITRNGFALGANHGFSIEGLLILLDGLLLGYIGLSRLFRFDMVPYVSGSAIWVGGVALVYFIWVYSAIPDFIASLKKDGISANEGPGGSVIVLGCLLAISAGFLLRSAQKRGL